MYFKHFISAIKSMNNFSNEGQVDDGSIENFFAYCDRAQIGGKCAQEGALELFDFGTNTPSPELFNLFTLHLKTYYSCVCCSKTCIISDTATSLQVPCPIGESDVVTLTECIERGLGGDVTTHCSSHRCVPHQRRMSFACNPLFLVLQLNRVAPVESQYKKGKKRGNISSDATLSIEYDVDLIPVFDVLFKCVLTLHSHARKYWVHQKTTDGWKKIDDTQVNKSVMDQDKVNLKPDTRDKNVRALLLVRQDLLEGTTFIKIMIL